MGYKFYTLKAQALTIRSQILGLLYYFRGIILSYTPYFASTASRSFIFTALARLIMWLYLIYNCVYASP